MSAVALDVAVVVDVTSVQRNHSDWFIRLFAEVTKFAKTELDLKRFAFFCGMIFAFLVKIRIQNGQSAAPKVFLCKIFLFLQVKKKVLLKIKWG